MNARALLKSIIEESRTLIKSKDFINTHRIGNSFTRSRKLSFTNLFYFIMHSTKKSLSINYSQFKMDFPELKLPIVSKQAISKARQGISHEAFHEIIDLSVMKYYELNSE